MHAQIRRTVPIIKNHTYIHIYRKITPNGQLGWLAPARQLSGFLPCVSHLQLNPVQTYHIYDQKCWQHLYMAITYYASSGLYRNVIIWQSLHAVVKNAAHLNLVIKCEYQIFYRTLPEFQKFLDDLCLKHGVECSHPRTAARLLDKVQYIRCMWFTQHAPTMCFPSPK